MEDETIKNFRITTPKDTIYPGKEGYHARLNNDASYCIKEKLGSTRDSFVDNVYLEINLPETPQITAIALQGKGQYGYGSSIKLQYQLENMFVTYKNIDGMSHVSFFIVTPLTYQRLYHESGPY